MLTDVSERKAMVDSLSSLTRDLEARAVELTARNRELQRGMAARADSEEQQRRLELRLREAQRLESLGLLAGGVAHDFNNLLVGVQGNAELLMMAPELPREQRRSLSLITRACQQAAQLTRQLLVFAGQGEISLTTLDPTAVIAETMELLRGRVPRLVTLRCELGAELPPIRADRSQLSRAVLNLVTNALEALAPDAAGSVIVDARAERLGVAALGEFQHHARAAPGLYIVLRVRDSGPGIDASTMTRIFDPFFSTKLAGRGLGLASVLGIAQAHAGALRVRSDPGTGSCFELAFPVSESSATYARPGRPEVSDWNGAGRILLIDDDGAVRRVTARLLRRLGFDVTQADGGMKGLACLQLAEPGFDLVVLDWRMPGMSGQQVLAALRRLKAALPVIVISGYSADHIKSHDPHTTFLQKPVPVAQLRDTLRRLLGYPVVADPCA
jgi:signal transduction histidine kinase